MRTGNPVLNDSTFRVESVGTSTMTLSGVVVKTGLLLGILLLTAAFSWAQVATNQQNAMNWAIGGAIGGLVLAVITCFKPTVAPYTSPVYAALEGLFLGAISAVFEAAYSGIVLQAVGLTFGTLFALLLAYTSGLIRATENFKLGVVAATGGIAILYLVNMVMHFAGWGGIPFIHESGWMGIGFSAFVVILAALNLVLDFDFIETGVEQGAPKYMEWYGAFGLLVTLIWLYVEILRLLAKLNSRD